jgi:hypothetical protein
MIKYCLIPSFETQKTLNEEKVKPDPHPDHNLSDWLKEFYVSHDAEYLFQVQFLENLEDQAAEHVGKPGTLRNTPGALSPKSSS